MKATLVKKTHLLEASLVAVFAHASVLKMLAFWYYYAATSHKNWQFVWKIQTIKYVRSKPKRAINVMLLLLTYMHKSLQPTMQAIPSYPQFSIPIIKDEFLLFFGGSFIIYNNIRT